METRYISTFLTVAELKNFTKAAESLHFSQSTVSNQIRHLESELGFQLFDRIGKKVDLTPSGMVFMKHAREILSHMQQLQDINADPSEMTGIFRVGSVESMIYGSMMHCVPLLHKKYPKIEMQIKVGYTSVLKERLKQNLLDLIVTIGDPNDDPLFDQLYLRRERIHFFASSQNELKNVDSLSLKEVLSQPLIGIEEGSAIHRCLMKLANSIALPLSYYFTLENIQALIALLAQGNFISLLPDYYVADHVEQGELIQLNVDMPEQYTYCQVLCYNNKWLPSYAQDLVNLINEHRPGTET